MLMPAEPMHPRKIETLNSMSAPERYRYFIRKVCDFEQLWGLVNGGWATGQVDTHSIIPVWPESTFAACNADGAWRGLQPRVILLDDFLGKWIPGANVDGYRFGVFPTPNQQAIVVANEILQADLLAELSQYR